VHFKHATYIVYVIIYVIICFILKDKLKFRDENRVFNFNLILLILSVTKYP